MDTNEAIRRTLADYCHFMDDGRLDDWADLFARDGVFTLLGESVATREAIREYAHASFSDPTRRGKHLTINPAIDGAEDVASVESDFLVLFPSPKGPVVRIAGRYLDRFVCDDGRWLFAERNVVIPTGWMPAA